MALRSLKGIKQLRFILCQSSQASNGLRHYIANNYESIRQSPARITVRQCEGSIPMAIATYAYGLQRKVNLRKFNEAKIQQAIRDLQSYSDKLSQQIKV